jgi:hypothetical protein
MHGSRHYHRLAVARTSTLALLVVVLSALACGCATTGGVGRAPLMGMVSLEGHEQVLSLDARGQVFAISGPARILDEIDRIVDARIAVRGKVSEGRIHIRAYEMVEAPDGLPPYVGRLVVDQSGVRLEDATTGTRIGLRGPELAAMKRHHAARVWVTGTVVGRQTLLIAHWGVLAPAEAPR